MRRFACAALLLLGCKQPPPRAPLPAEPVALDLGRPPIINPLNLRDLGIPGARGIATVGAIDGEEIAIDRLDERSGRPFTRVGQRIYDAREAGWRWLLERTALTRLARSAGVDLPSLLEREWAALPAPSDAELADASSPIRELPEAERKLAARSLWRIRKWAVARSLLVQQGLAGVSYGRLQLMLIAPGIDKPETPVAKLDGRDVTRAELRRLAGYQEQLAAVEYVHIARLQFDAYAGDHLVAREAARQHVTVAELEARELKRLGPPSPAEVDQFVRENPPYAAAPDGRAKARETLADIRPVKARESLRARLRSAAKVEFFLSTPPFAPAKLELVAPLSVGDAHAPAVLTALHGLGCDNCARGTKLIFELLAAFPQLRLESAEYFSRDRLGSYRAALAVRCAADAGKAGELMTALVSGFRAGLVGELAELGRAHGLGDAFRRCLEEDRHLPIIFENLALAERVGLERNVPGLFVNGIRLDDLTDPVKLRAHVEEALRGSSKSDN